VRLDAGGYHMLSIQQRAEVDAWLEGLGLDGGNVRWYRIYGEGEVEISTYVRDEDGKVKVVHGEACTQEAIFRTAVPPPHFNPPD